MSNIEITNVDTGSPELKDGRYRDELLVFAGAATVKAGTLLARQSVATAITVAADGGNTGDGTVTLATVVTGPVVPLVGDYNLECIAAVTNGGTFKLEDPNGMLVDNNLVMTAGAGAATVFEVGGMQFTITDGATDFVVGDKFALTVAADGKMIPFATDGAGGAQFPVAIMQYEVVATGAGNVPVRPLVAGDVKKNRLVINADGDGSNITAAILDQLRDYSIVAIDESELGILDNQ